MSHSLRKLVFTVVAGVGCLGGAIAGVAASAGAQPAQSQNLVLNASLAPSLPSYSDIYTVPPGGAPWLLQAGHVVLGAGGHLNAVVTGLVLATTGTNPVPEIAASVYCNGAQAGTTAPVPFSTAGNAHVQTTLALPTPCLVPAVLLTIRPATTTLYIAFDGTN